MTCLAGVSMWTLRRPDRVDRIEAGPGADRANVDPASG